AGARLAGHPLTLFLALPVELDPFAARAETGAADGLLVLLGHEGLRSALFRRYFGMASAARPPPQGFRGLRRPAWWPAASRRSTPRTRVSGARRAGSWTGRRARTKPPTGAGPADTPATLTSTRHGTSGIRRQGTPSLRGPVNRGPQSDLLLGGWVSLESPALKRGRMTRPVLACSAPLVA